MAKALMKQVTGGDPIRACKMTRTSSIPADAQDHPRGQPQAVVRGTDHAVWRRIKLVPFTVTIPEAEKDKNLPEKLKAESPGILKWAVGGCLDWQRDGLGNRTRCDRRPQRTGRTGHGDQVHRRCCHRFTRRPRCNRRPCWRPIFAWSGDKLMTAPAFRKRTKDKGFESKEGTGGRDFRRGSAVRNKLQRRGETVGVGGGNSQPFLYTPGRERLGNASTYPH